MPEENAPKKPTIEERLEALTMSMELANQIHESEMKTVRELLSTAGHNIDALARIAQSHDHRIEHLEGK